MGRFVPLQGATRAVLTVSHVNKCNLAGSSNEGVCV